MLDMLAQRYGLLPSELLERATTIDLMVFNTSMKWTVEQQQRQAAEASGKPYVKPPPKMTTEQLQAMIERVRSRGD